MQLFRALNHPNYRLYFAGQGISLIGTWMQRIALSWLIYRLGGSVMLLGVIGFISDLPAFFLSPFAGVLADRWDRRIMAIVIQVLAMLQAFILALLVLLKVIKVWHIAVLSGFLGLVTAFDITTRQAFVMDVVQDKNVLGNAIALNSSMVNSARLIGPSVAGVLIAAMGEGPCFLVNAVSYLAGIIAFVLIKTKPRTVAERPEQVLEKLREGFHYAMESAPISSVLLLLALVSLMGMPYQVLMPVFAKDILQGGPHTLGFLVAASGIGALGGALYLASRNGINGFEKIIPMAALLFGCGLIAFALSREFVVSTAIMLFTGCGMIVQMAASNTLIQTIVDDDKRGRIMSFYTMAFRGMIPFGSLLTGVLADKVGAPGALIIGGVSCIAGSLWFVRRLPVMRKAMSIH
jgi:MFS family permease